MKVLQFPQTPKRIRPKSLADRWGLATARCADVTPRMREVLDEFVNAFGELREVQEGYQDCRDKLPTNFINSRFAEKVEEVCGLFIEGILDEYDRMSSALANAEKVIGKATSIDLPRGFGRD